MTQQKREELEAKIAEMEQMSKTETVVMSAMLIDLEISFYKELLSETIVLPVEESWGSCDKNNLLYREAQYPNGVIIKTPHRNEGK
ncbi:MAG: hypothetical protein [Podoviridae sp. ctrTa16]|nr:MAG: hypothetical protein [Podoviridae sp. ctrTa16]